MRQGDIGTVISVSLRDESNRIVDLTNNESIKMHIVSPSGKSLLKNCDVNLPLTSGNVKYVIAGDDIASETGSYTFEVIVVFKSGSRFTSSSNSFDVLPTLPYSVSVSSPAVLNNTQVPNASVVV